MSKVERIVLPCNPFDFGNIHVEKEDDYWKCFHFPLILYAAFPPYPHVASYPQRRVSTQTSSCIQRNNCRVMANWRCMSQNAFSLMPFRPAMQRLGDFFSEGRHFPESCVLPQSRPCDTSVCTCPPPPPHQGSVICRLQGMFHTGDSGPIKPEDA
jgi:hypothetical protein